MPRNPDHRGATREEFEHFQRRRPIALRSVATQLECWRYLCTLPDCRRAKACVGPNGEHCAHTFLRTCFSDKERATLKEALGLRLAGFSADAAWEEAERRVEMRAREPRREPLSRMGEGQG